MNTVLPSTKVDIAVSDSSSEGDLDDDGHVIRFMIYFILVVLIIFIAAFIYNLIKCYLPKWKRDQRPYPEEIDMKEVPYKMQSADESA